MSVLTVLEPAPSDAELIARARTGDDDAYAELYERHVGAARAAARALTSSRTAAEDLVAEGFTRLLAALRNGTGPEVAFRPYLLACVRNAFYDRTRKDRRVDWSDDVETAVPATSLALLDPGMDPEERQLIARAFTTLPERWQLVLWHTEVEGRNPAEVAPLLGLAPNAVAALAYRAREGLKKAYLQAHLQQQAPEACRYTRERLGAYVRDGVNAKERAQIEQHLERCDDCTAVLAELTQVDSTLRRALIPLVIGVGPAAYLKFAGGGGVVRRLSRSRRARVTAGVASVAAVVAAGLAMSAADDGDSTLEAVASSSIASTTTRPAASSSSAPRPSSSPGTVSGTPAAGPAPVVGPPSTVFVPTSRPTSTSIVNSRPTAGTTATTVRTTATTVRPTTTTRRPGATTTTVRPTTTAPPTTIDPDDAPDRDPPTTPAGAPPPVVRPPAPVPPPADPGPTAPGAAAFSFSGVAAPSFTSSPYGGDTVGVLIPVRNDGADGAPTVALAVTGGTPRSLVLAGAPGGRQQSDAGCHPDGDGGYQCPTVPAGATATLRFDLDLGAVGGRYHVVASIAGARSEALEGDLLDPLGVTATPTAEGLDVALTNRAAIATVADRNPVSVTTGGAVLRATALDAATRSACGAITVDAGALACANVPALGPQQTATLRFAVEADGVFAPTATVGAAAPVPPPPPPTLVTNNDNLFSGLGPLRVDVRTPQSQLTAPKGAVIRWVGVYWLGSPLTIGSDTSFGNGSCAQNLEGLDLRACVWTDRRFDPYTMGVRAPEGQTVDWRMIIVAEVPGDPLSSVEVFTRPSGDAATSDSFILDGNHAGVPSLGVVGFRGGRGGVATLADPTGGCAYVNPYPDAFTARPPAAAEPGCVTLGEDVRFEFYGPPAVIPKLFILQRPVAPAQ